MRYVILAVILIVPTLVYGDESSFQGYVGKKYWVTGKIFDLKTGACDSKSFYRNKYEVKVGQSFEITEYIEKIPYDDSSGTWNGLNIKFDNGDRVCMDAIFFKFAEKDVSETNPAEEYLGKKFWIKMNVSSKYYNRDYEKGKCGESSEKYYPEKRQSFIVKSFIPKFYPFHNEAEVIFDDNQTVCVRIDSVKYDVTTEDPVFEEKRIMEGLNAAGIKKGKSLWLKYPMDGIPGLTKVTISKIENIIDDINITFESEKYEDYTVTFSNIEKITDNYYQKLPKKLSKLSKKAALAIAKRQIFLGMTSNEAIASWGLPSNINRTAGKWGVHEQWIYGDNTYLYFQNGKLTSWQD